MHSMNFAYAIDLYQHQVTGYVKSALLEIYRWAAAAPTHLCILHDCVIFE